MGWFDDKENGVSVLTSSMAQDTSIINGVSTESLGPSMEGAFALLVGLAVGFWACWQVALVALVVSPVLAVGSAIGMKLSTGLVEEENEALKEANLLCGDAIANYKTVQSLGNTELIVKKYEDLLAPAKKKAFRAQMKVGFAFGFS